MADNLTLNAGSGGETLATDDVSGVHYPIGKVAWGALNTATLITLADALPVQPGTSTSWVVSNAGTFAVQASDGGGSLTVDAPVGTPVFVRLSDGSSPISTLPVSAAQSGAWSLTNISGTISLPTGAATQATLAEIRDRTPDLGPFGGVPVEGGWLTNSQLRADPVSVSVDASNTQLSVSIEGVNVTVPVSLASLPELPAGTNLVGRVSGSDETSTVYNGTTALTPKFAVIDHATSGDNTLVAAVASKKIRVLSCFLVAAGAVTVRFESGAGGTALTGQMNVAANGGFVLPYNPLGWFETASNTLLNLELSGAVSADGSLVYVEV